MLLRQTKSCLGSSEGGLKSKMEFQWSDITDLKATCLENGLGNLDIVIKFIALRSV